MSSVFGTMFIALILQLTSEGGSSDILEGLVFGLLIAHVVALPITLVCLALCGIPAVMLLHNHADSWWMPVVALIVGGLAGQLVSTLIDMNWASSGLVVGALAGLLWHQFARRGLERA